MLDWLLPQTGSRGCPLCAQEVNLGQLYLGREVQYMLHSMVCFYGAHYEAFARSREASQWLLFNDTHVSVVGAWEDVVEKCVSGHKQPCVLFFERVGAP